LASVRRKGKGKREKTEWAEKKKAFLDKSRGQAEKEIKSD
jgi:hypothetical protein